MQIGRLGKSLKEKFDYDVTGLPAWTDNTMPNVITDVIENSNFLGRLTLEENVKGTLEIALLNADVTLQAKVACTPSPDGSVIFTKENLTTVPLYMGIEFCNEDLNTKMTQVLNALGLKRQDGQLPAPLEDILMAYLLKNLQRKAQRLVILGDTTSLDAELSLMNGLRYRINNNTSVVDYMSAEASITAANAYAIVYGLFKAIPSELFDNGYTIDIFMGRDKALLVLEDWNNANPYSQVAIPAEVGTSMEFVLPLTNIKITTLPELNGTNDVWALPLALTFLGVDSLEDMSYEIKYDAYNDKLKAEASFRLGTSIVWGQYFTRLQLAVS
jgi:hypothetical protein